MYQESQGSPTYRRRAVGHQFPLGIYTHLTLDGQKQAAAKIDEIFGPVAVRVAVKHDRRKPS